MIWNRCGGKGLCPEDAVRALLETQQGFLFLGKSEKRVYNKAPWREASGHIFFPAIMKVSGAGSA
jgi:hypothetical protein